MVRALPFTLGLLLLVIATTSIVRTMVIPRATVSFVYAVVLRVTDGAFRGIARLMRTYPARDRVLAWSGPVGVIVSLFAWLVLFLVAYALMIFGITASTLGQSFLQAGSSLLTLGLIGTPSQDVTFIDFLAAMTGPAVIALLIGFLPTLYQSYLARESRVLLASSFTGAPAWGPEMLVRVHLLQEERSLPGIYADWIPWCAQVRLTQTLYPALNRFRSPVASRNWIIALVAVLDSAAIRLATSTGNADPRTVAMISEGTQTILALSATEIDIDTAVHLSRRKHRVQATLSAFGMTQGTTDHAPTHTLSEIDPGIPPGVGDVSRAITLDSLRGRLGHHGEGVEGLTYDDLQSSITREEFGKALDYLRSAGIEVQRSDDDAFAIFRQLRGRYESAAYHLAQRFSAVRAPWTGDRRPETPVVPPSPAGPEAGT